VNHMANNERNAGSSPDISPEPGASRPPESAMAGQGSQTSATGSMHARPRLTVEAQVSEEGTGDRLSIGGVQHAPDQGSVAHGSPVSPTSSRKRARGLSLRSQPLFPNSQDQYEARATGTESSAHPAHHAHSEHIGIELAAVADKNEAESKSTEDIPIAQGDRTRRNKKLKSTANDTLPNYTQWAQKQGQSLGCRAQGLFYKIRKKLLRINEIPPSKDGRHIPLVHVGQKEQLIDERTGRHYMNNTIRSSRYTLWTFLPRQLIAQFSKLANL